MYFLTKFCRICITANENLKNIDSCDYDSIKISEKLKVFTKTVEDMDNWSAFICSKCIKKLRISYEFDKMCKKSTVILSQYLTELFSCTDNNNTEKFINSEIQIQVEKLPAPSKRRYIKRERRCSLLKDLLTKIKDDRKYFEIPPTIRTRRSWKALRNANAQGGLRPLLQFTRSYNYGYKIENNKIENVTFDRSPIEKLTDFVNNFFKVSLSRFHEKINSVLEESEEWFEESDDFYKMIKKPRIAEPMKFEEVIVEPDIAIKKEIISDEIVDENTEFEMSYGSISTAVTQIKIEKIQSVNCPSTSSASNSYSIDSSFTGTTNTGTRIKLEKINIKEEPQDNTIPEDDQFIIPDTHNYVRNSAPTGSKSNAEIYPTLCETLGRQSQSSLNLLQQFTETNFRPHHRAAYSVLNRAKRGKYPFINPQLKKQFLNQDFKCNVCHRRFKSQGYLQAHYSKMKHKS